MPETVVESVSARPRGPLRAIVAAHHGFRVQNAAPAGHLGLASPFLTLIFTLDDPLLVSRHNEPSGSYRTLSAGLHTSPVVVEHRGNESGIQLQLDPLGARQLFGLPAAELADLDVPAEELLGPAAGRLQEMLQAASDWPTRFALLDRQLGDAIGDAAEVEPEVAWTWRRLRRTHGRATVSGLARDVGWSQRHLAARFRAEFGLTPKLAARVIRFDRARRLLTSGNAARVAAHCNYADQSHLVREFRAFTGLSPSGWLASEVGNVQVTEPVDGADSTS